MSLSLSENNVERICGFQAPVIFKFCTLLVYRIQAPLTPCCALLSKMQDLLRPSWSCISALPIKASAFRLSIRRAALNPSSRPCCKNCIFVSHSEATSAVATSTSPKAFRTMPSPLSKSLADLSFSAASCNAPRSCNQQRLPLSKARRAAENSPTSVLPLQLYTYSQHFPKHGLQAPACKAWALILIHKYSKLKLFKL